jgi:hypothetical protein
MGAMREDKMTLDPYHHEHAGVEEVPWSRLSQWLPNLAEKICEERYLLFAPSRVPRARQGEMLT